MRKSRVVVVVVLLAVIGLVGGYWYERPVMFTGSGYAAHSACATVITAHRDNPRDDLPPDPLSILLRLSYGDQSVTASGLGIIAKKTAWFTPGYGCTVADERPNFVPPTPVNAQSNPFTNAPSPGDGPLKAAIDHAFGTDLSATAQKQLGTRAVVVVHDGKIIAERYAPGFTKDTPQISWSMTKSLTNLLVGRLVYEGKLNLDQDHLRPEWTDERASITIRQLMQMTSGLEWQEIYALNTPVTRMFYLHPDMGAYVASQKLVHPPGQFLQYSTGSTTLLCSIIAPKNGGPDFPRRALFAPLGLTSAVLEPDAVGTPVCGAYLWATPRDWATIGQFALDDGVWNGQRLLPKGWMADSVKAVPAAETEEIGYGSGWWTNKDFAGNVIKTGLPADTYYAEGHDGQRMVIVPSERLVVVQMSFTQHSPEFGRSLKLAADAIAALHH
ncbi:MAG: beta-lactamase family protein [Nocardiaceae bacterium]|nr:beta-lactamase family protein [Nocardiaceae bacterium]